MNYKLGDFSFIKDKLTRETLEYDFNVINNIPGAWDEFREHDLDKSFMYQTCGQIWDKIAAKAYPGHSSASFGMSMLFWSELRGTPVACHYWHTTDSK